MAMTLDGKLVVAISSRALFDFEEENQVFEQADDTAYMRLQLLTLSIDRKPEDALAYLKKKGYTFPVGFVTPAIHRVLPKPKGLPITLVRGRDGRLLQAEKGQLFPEDVELLARWAA